MWKIMNGLDEERRQRRREKLNYNKRKIEKDLGVVVGLERREKEVFVVWVFGYFVGVGVGFLFQGFLFERGGVKCGFNVVVDGVCVGMVMEEEL